MVLYGSMGEPRTDQLNKVNFHCRACGLKFSAAPSRVEDAPERAYHPWHYFAGCLDCGLEAGQANWEKGLMATFGKHTGPKTTEGKASSAANLEGHPTPEEAQRTRFNAITTGAHAQTATFFPAKPGGYPHCTGCEYLESMACWDSPSRACLKRTELLLQHQIAFETGDPRLLTDLRSRTQAMVQALIDDMILAIISSGVELKQPEWYFDPKGEKFHIVSFEKDGQTEFSYKVSAHPLLKTLGDFLSKNNMTLSDLEMTPKQQTQDTLLEGYLEQQGGERETALEFQQKQTELLENLQHQIGRSRENLKRDPVMIEYNQAENDG